MSEFTILSIGMAVGVIGVLMLALALVYFYCARQMLKSLGGRWTWGFGLSADGLVMIIPWLWAENPEAKEALDCCACSQIQTSPDGRAIFQGVKTHGPFSWKGHYLTFRGYKPVAATGEQGDTPPARQR